jgi:hypothetical protein
LADKGQLILPLFNQIIAHPLLPPLHVMQGVDQVRAGTGRCAVVLGTKVRNVQGFDRWPVEEQVAERRHRLFGERFKLPDGRLPLAGLPVV